MKGFTEMTDQEILALTEEDVQKLIKLRMMEEGIKIMDKPKIPELFEIEPADIQYFSIPLLDGFAFTDINEATKVAEILKSAKSLRKVDYDWNKLGSDYKFLKKSEKYKFNGNSDFDIISGWAYSDELYAKISNFAAQNKVMKEQAAKDQKEYDEKMQIWEAEPFFLICEGKERFYVLPKKALYDEQIFAMRRFLRQKLGKRFHSNF